VNTNPHAIILAKSAQQVRMYYIQRGSVLILMLGGGDKSTQTADITKAVKLAATIEE